MRFGCKAIDMYVYNIICSARRMHKADLYLIVLEIHSYSICPFELLDVIFCNVIIVTSLGKLETTLLHFYVYRKSSCR